MKNYYEFNKLINDGESINFYSSLSREELIKYLNLEVDDIDYYLNYYSELFKTFFNGKDYDEHYYLFKSLLKCLNNIKIILNLLKGKDSND